MQTLAFSPTLSGAVDRAHHQHLPLPTRSDLMVRCCLGWVPPAQLRPPGQLAPDTAQADDGCVRSCAGAGQSLQAPRHSPGLVLQPFGQETAQAAGKLCEEATELLRWHVGDDVPEGHLGKSPAEKQEREHERGAGQLRRRRWLEHPEPPALCPALAEQVPTAHPGERARAAARPSTF